MKKYIITPAIALAALLFGTGTANASTDSYLARLNEEIPRVVQQYGPQALVDVMTAARGSAVGGKALTAALTDSRSARPRSAWAVDISLGPPNRLGCSDSCWAMNSAAPLGGVLRESSASLTHARRTSTAA